MEENDALNPVFAFHVNIIIIIIIIKYKAFITHIFAWDSMKRLVD